MTGDRLSGTGLRGQYLEMYREMPFFFSLNAPISREITSETYKERYEKNPCNASKDMAVTAGKNMKCYVPAVEYK